MGEAFLVNRGYSVSFAEPVYLYTGSSRVEQTSYGFKLYMTTSGVLSFDEIGTGNWDVFLVGGGGAGACSGAGGNGGGGGGYTTTQTSIPLKKKTSYNIIVGAGAPITASVADGANGGTSSAFGFSAEGGRGGIRAGQPKPYGGAGGSGGGGGGYTSKPPGTGGSNGSNGGTGAGGDGVGGTGQGTTTYEFGDSSQTLYAGGGAGGASNTNTTYAGGDGGGGRGGSQNTVGTSGTNGLGGGGGGGGNTARAAGGGGDGIVVLRYTRY